ncbi:regulator of cell cycle RGCC-like [Silurus meridionalis]|uniref:Uncharacterized protein n=1 Tax=Silurus meridionalis TaxID=175797 RepID=A0A8T0BJ41_SILME|nr:regulator of cell cycle RGCC-like [Silurus meridionalis]KAF7707119.1 hypothetical protein HF521_018337 [Silurus meridionalis]
MSSLPFTDLDSEMGELLDEFEAVVEKMSVPPVSARVAELRGGYGDAVTDSGIEDADDASEPSQASSLNASVEELNTAGVSTSQKAKLGDTSDLESFIENLDKELAEM